MFDLDECVAFVTKESAKILADVLNNRLVKYGVTRSQWTAMYFIDRDGALNQKDLADYMGTSQPTTTGILDRLEKQNFIERKEDKNDKRKKVVVLTEEGKKTVEKLNVIAEDFKNASLEKIDKKDQDTFLQVLYQMVDSAKEWDQETNSMTFE